MPRPLALAALLAACSPNIVEGTSEPASTSGESSSSGDETGPTSTSETGDVTVTGLPETSSDTGETTEPTSDTDSPTTAALPTCGDGTVDDGELCDDANADESDACTSKCAPPSCSDAIVSGDESDVDCGGACPDCPAGGTCEDKADCASLACDAGACAGLFESCRALHDMHPDLPDEAYNIDPAQNNTPVLVYCDMKNGGWTEAAKDTLETKDGWSAGDIGGCGDLSDKMLGPFGMGAKPGKMFTLLGVPHEKARAHATFVIIDSWDNERANVFLDGDEVGAQLCHFFENPMLCNTVDDQCGQGIFPEGKVDVIGERNHNVDAVLVEVGSTLNEAVDNEAFGLDAISVFVY